MARSSSVTFNKIPLMYGRGRKGHDCESLIKMAEEMQNNHPKSYGIISIYGLNLYLSNPCATISLI